MSKDETIKSIESGKGLPPIGGKKTSNGMKKENRSTEGLKPVAFRAVPQKKNK